MSRYAYHCPNDEEELVAYIARQIPTKVTRYKCPICKWDCAEQTALDHLQATRVDAAPAGIEDGAAAAKKGK